MTDKELLELAAKAAGIDGWWEQGYLSFIKRAGGVWNPLEEDGDALRLAVKLNIDIGEALGWYYNNESSEYDKDPYSATRRAIVRAAAEIGKTL